MPNRRREPSFGGSAEPEADEDRVAASSILAAAGERGERPTRQRRRPGRRRRRRGWMLWLWLVMLGAAGGSGYYGYREYMKRHVSLDAFGQADAGADAGAEDSYVRPAEGSDFGPPQLRWCLREQLRLEALSEVTRTNTEIGKVLALYRTQQRLCAPLEQQLPAARAAAADFIAERADAIRQQAVDDQLFLLGGVESAELEGSEMVREAQMLLLQLGYDAGGVDGAPGNKTIAAVQAFQKAAGLTPTGKIDLRLLSQLQQARAQQLRSQP